MMYSLVLTAGEYEVALPPRCPDCILNRVISGHMTETKYTPRPPTKRMKKLARKQEQKVMDGIGGRRQCASGALPGYKSDGRLLGRVRMEAKFTFAKVFALRHEDLQKLRGECEGRERPAFVIDFKNRASGKTQDRWVAIPHVDWEKMINAASDNS
jgi:hypothetical protein